MAGKTVKRNINYPIRENINIGEVHISDDVVVMISALAATEIEGVAYLPGNITKNAVSKVGNGKLSKAVKIKVNQNVVDLSIVIHVKEGYDIPDVCRSVQEKVLNAVETMTSLQVSSVNVKVAGIALGKDKT